MENLIKTYKTLREHYKLLALAEKEYTPLHYYYKAKLEVYEYVVEDLEEHQEGEEI